MGRRRNRHPGITDMAWRYLTDCVTEADRDTWEYTLLESDQLDHSTGYRTADIWNQYRDQILADWIRRHPATRPCAWWRFESGLERRMGGIELPDGRVIGCNVLYSLRDSIPEDQRQYLAEHGHLQPGE